MSINHELFDTKQKNLNEIQTDSNELNKELEISGQNNIISNIPVSKQRSKKKSEEDVKKEKTQNKMRMDLFASEVWRTQNKFVVNIPGKTALKTTEFKKRFSNQYSSKRRKKKQKNTKSRLYQKLVNYNTLLANTQGVTTQACDNAAVLYKKYNVDTDNRDFADLTQFLSADSKNQFMNEDLVKIFLANKDDEGNINENSARMALVKMAEQLFDFDINSLHLESDTEMIRDAAKLEKLSSQLGAFDRLAEKYHFFEQLKYNKHKELTSRISTLRTISAYYLVRKELITNPVYKEHYDFEMSMDFGAAGTEENKHVAELLMKAHILGKKLVSEHGRGDARRNLINQGGPDIRTEAGRRKYRELEASFGDKNDSRGLKEIIDGVYESTGEKTAQMLENRLGNNEIGLNESLEMIGDEQRLSGNLQKDQEKHTVFGDIELKTILTSDEITPLKGTKEMAKVRNDIEALALVMSEKMPEIVLNDDGQPDAEKEEKAKKIFDNTSTIITVLYNRLSESLKAVITKYGEAYPELAQMLTAFSAQNDIERDSFREKALEFRSLMVSDPEFAKEQDKSWISVVRHNRGVFYDLDNDKTIEYKTDGANASILYSIKKDGKTVYFRKKDCVPSDNNSELAVEAMDGIKLDEETADRLTKMFANLPRNRKAFGEIVTFINKLKKKKESPSTIAEAFINRYGYRDAAKKRLVLSDKDKVQFGQALVQYVTAILKRNISHEIDASPKISEKRNLSDRNVATSRLANFLGMQSIVCDSRNATIRMNGKLIEGNLMEGSGGVETNSKPMPYSMNAISQIFMVHIFDYICGQVDRHFANFHGVVKDGTIVAIKCLDNDMSFGLLKPTDLKRMDVYDKGYNQLRPLSTELIKGMPAGFANKILGIDRAFLDQLLGDILNKAELDALSDRLNWIKEEIKAVTYAPQNAKLEKSGYQNKATRIVYLNEDKDDELRQLKCIKKLKQRASHGKSFEMRCLLYYDNIEAMGGIDKLISDRRKQLEQGGNNAL